MVCIDVDDGRRLRDGRDRRRWRRRRRWLRRFVAMVQMVVVGGGGRGTGRCGRCRVYVMVIGAPVQVMELVDRRDGGRRRFGAAVQATRGVYA